MGDVEHAKIEKRATGFGVRIPASCVEEAGFAAGAEVDVTVERGALVIRPATRRHDLQALLARVTRKNRHALLEW